MQLGYALAVALRADSKVRSTHFIAIEIVRALHPVETQHTVCPLLYKGCVTKVGAACPGTKMLVQESYKHVSTNADGEGSMRMTTK